jgi:hypothetical protein
MAKQQNVALSSVASKYDPNHDYTIKVSEVFVDWKWNTRVDVASQDPESETDEAGFQETLVSIGKDGQRTACVLRPNPYKGKAGHPGARYEFMLVEGFGRTRAKCEIAAGEHDDALGAAGMLPSEINKLHTKEPTILAKVIAMTEAEARKRNLGENMLRSQLSAPDIAYGIFKLAEAEPNASNVQLGAMIGRSEPYVAKLRRIYSAFSGVTVPADTLWKGSPAMPVTQAWRCAPKKALNEDMLGVADKDAKTPLTNEEKLDKYLIASSLKVDPNAKPKKKSGQGAWAANACIDAHAFGAVLGALQREGALTVDGLTADHWTLIVPKYAGKADKATDDEKDAIVTACNKGVTDGAKVAKKKEAKAVAPSPDGGPKDDAKRAAAKKNAKK